MNRLIIIGASGHGKVVADIAKKNGYRDIVFLDSNPSVTVCAGYPVLGPDTMLADMEGDVCIAIGNTKARKRLMLQNAGRRFPCLIHPAATIADGVFVGEGTVIMAGAVVNPCVRIGRGCILNTASSVDHDCSVSDFVHIAVGAHVCGTVAIGEETWVGAGATISNNVVVCGGCMIGAGAVVIKDIKTQGTYIGVPARIQKDSGL